MQLDAAIKLAGFGFKASDVASYRKLNVDLYDVVHRFFSTAATSEEQMLLADTILVAKVIENDTLTPRRDGFLSAIAYKVIKQLKGSPNTGDVVYLPQRSGINKDGTIESYTTDISQGKPGRTYLLVMSKNWYEQWVVEHGKRPELGFNALAFLIYEVADDGKLLAHPRPTLTDDTPRDVKVVQQKLKQMPNTRN